MKGIKKEKKDWKQLKEDGKKKLRKE